VEVFCAGVARDDLGRLVTAGGRVLNVCGTGPTLHEARLRAYAGVNRIGWSGLQVRTDIAATASEA
jgi:phosphoribosylamine--glycine ligase